VDTISITGPVDDGEPTRNESHSHRERTTDVEPSRERDDAGDQSHQHAGNRQHARRSSEHHIPDRNGILVTMARLPQLVAAGIVSPGQSNAMLATLRTLLSQLPNESARSAVHGINPASLRDAVRTTPELLDLISPLLSETQLAELLDEGGECNGT
jgi:hypothetical protein